MLNRKKCKKMWVWEDDSGKTEKVERIVIDINTDGSCTAVRYGSETSFLSGDRYYTLYWNRCHEIKEPKMRSMTYNEILGFLANTSSLIVRHHGRDPQVPTFFRYTDDPDKYEWSTITETGEIGEWHKFEVEDTD